MSLKDITIIITTFKSEDKIDDCLNSIDKRCKILLIENSDNREFKKIIENKFSNVECILSGENLGYGKANNIGLRKVQTKYALILNPDAKLNTSTLENFIEAAKKINKFAIMAPYIQEKKDEYKTSEIKDFSISVKNVKGFAMFLNLEEFNDIGFFDENFFIYFEEIDLCRRLNLKNKKIYLIPSIEIFHSGAQSHNKNINNEMEFSRNWHWMWSTFYYNRKYSGFLISLVIVFPKLFSAIFKILLYSLFFNKYKKKFYYQRYSGLINSIFGKKSWYRPKV